MNDDPMSITKALPDYLAERRRDLNRLAFKEDGEFVLYWMHHAARGHENPALDTAVFVAGRLGLPVLVYQGLGGRHPYNSDRHHTFIMEGARDVQQELAHRGITYRFYLARDPGGPTPLKELTARAALVLTEDFSAPPFTAWSRRLAASSRAAFWAVDTACILPMPVLKKSYARAYQFRKDTWGEFKKRMTRRYEDLKTEVQRFQGRLAGNSSSGTDCNIMPEHATMRPSRFLRVSAACPPTCIMDRCRLFESPGKPLHPTPRAPKNSWMKC